MKYGYNKCIFGGNVGKDPETRYTQDGTAVCNFSLACNEKRKTGEHVEWVNCVAFGKLAEIIEQHVKKGSSLLIEGKQSTSSWEDKEGQRRYKTECVVTEMRFIGGKQQEQKQKSGPGQTNTVDDSDIPF